MPVVPDPPTIEVGTSSTSELNQFRDAIAFSLKPPIAELRQTSAQTITTGGTGEPIEFNTHDVDEDYTGANPGHDDVTDNSRWAAQYSGWYLVSGAVVFAINATGARYAWLRVNGTDVNGSTGVMQAFASNFITVHARTKKIFLNVGDYVELIGFHDVGSNLDTAVVTRNQSTLSVHWVSN